MSHASADKVKTVVCTVDALSDVPVESILVACLDTHICAAVVRVHELCTYEQLSLYAVVQVVGVTIDTNPEALCDIRTDALIHIVDCTIWMGAAAVLRTMPLVSSEPEEQL